jgi:hypothetical protein
MTAFKVNFDLSSAKFSGRGT